jgi:hypothetical protein
MIPSILVFVSDWESEATGEQQGRKPAFAPAAAER